MESLPRLIQILKHDVECAKAEAFRIMLEVSWDWLPKTILYIYIYRLFVASASPSSFANLSDDRKSKDAFEMGTSRHMVPSRRATSQKAWQWKQ